MNISNDHPVFEKTLKYMYPAYVETVQKKDRTKEELYDVILWLTGYTKNVLNKMLDSEITLKEFIIYIYKIL